jgi:hypothetical protein
MRAVVVEGTFMAAESRVDTRAAEFFRTVIAGEPDRLWSRPVTRDAFAAGVCVALFGAKLLNSSPRNIIRPAALALSVF